MPISYGFGNEDARITVTSQPTFPDHVSLTFLHSPPPQTSESLEKTFSWSCFKKKKNGETETKRILDNFRTPKPQEIFITVAIVCHCYERLAVLQNVLAIILL